LEKSVEKDLTKIATRIIGLGKKNEDGSHAVTAEYISPLAEVYGIIDATPVIDARFTDQESLLEHIKCVLENGYINA
jgi:hypothetical protein